MLASCRRITGIPRPSNRGHRYESGLHEGSQRQPRERAGGVLKVSRHPICGGGLRPDSEDREPGRCRGARSAETETVDVAEESGELGGERVPEVGIDGSGKVSYGYG